MADIITKVQEKYGIDLNQANVLKLYKIETADISSDDLEKKIADCRRKWTQSINGANEKFAERDRLHLEKADTYEAILRNQKMLKELCAFYSKTKNSESSTEFAREYFNLVGTTKKIRKRDVDFFFDYYQSERKNKKAILEMLGKEFKIVGLGKEKAYADEEDDVAIAGVMKKTASPLVVNLFQEATILQIHKCEGYYQDAAGNANLCERYPKLKESLYELLELGKMETLETLSANIAKWREEVFNLRQEKGPEYAPFVDLFNTLTDLIEYQDVVDNFVEFKLLMQYPKLTPYMYGFDEMKKDTFQGILEIANRDYVFRDLNDFILTYFQPIYDNFNIHGKVLKGILTKAEKKAKSNQVLNKIDEKLGRKKKRRIPLVVNVIHWMVYWPIFLAYMITEIFYYLILGLKQITKPIFVGAFLSANYFIPKLFQIENMLVLRKIISKTDWYDFIYSFFSVKVEGFTAFIFSVVAILLLLMIYVLPSLLVTFFIDESSSILLERFDWGGLKRTFQKIFQVMREKTEEKYQGRKLRFYRKYLVGAFMNLVCVAVLSLGIYYTPVAARFISEKTGYGKVIEEKQDSTKQKKATVIKYKVTASLANVREGAGTDYEVVTMVSEGDTLIGTGNKEVGDSGTTWYEIYLDDEKTQTAWASEKVIKRKKKKQTK